MSVIRAFIAINISPEIGQMLETILRELQQELKGIPVRWVPVKNIHITLKFLGDVSVSNLDVLKKIFSGEAAAHRPFEISAGGLGAFPSIKRPRVIWVDVQAPAELTALQRAIDHETARLGYPREDRPFSPHLTIGRVSRNTNADELRRLSAALTNAKTSFVEGAKVEDVFLYRSDLQPSGAVYTPLFSARLGESS